MKVKSFLTIINKSAIVSIIALLFSILSYTQSISIDQRVNRPYISIDTARALRNVSDGSLILALSVRNSGGMPAANVLVSGQLLQNGLPVKDIPSGSRIFIGPGQTLDSTVSVPGTNAEQFWKSNHFDVKLKINYDGVGRGGYDSDFTFVYSENTERYLGLKESVLK